MYRIASVLLMWFAAGRTLGFRELQPQWGIAALAATIESIPWNAQGFLRCCWDFYSGFGLFVSVLLTFAGARCWQLPGLSPESLRSLAGICWSLALCFLAVTFLSGKYFLVASAVFSILTSVGLFLAAGLTARAT